MPYGLLLRPLSFPGANRDGLNSRILLVVLANKNANFIATQGIDEKATQDTAWVAQHKAKKLTFDAVKQIVGEASF